MTLDPRHFVSERSADRPDCPGLAALVRFAETASAVDAIERMLLAYALHPHGLGFERVHLLLHDEPQDQLIAWTGAARPSDALPLAEAVARAGLAPPPAVVTTAVRRVRWPAESLDGLAHLAWEGEPIAIHLPELGAGGEAAVRLETGERRHGIVVGGWETGGDADARRERLERFRAAARRALGAFERRMALTRAERRLELLAKLSEAQVSSLNIAEVLHLAVESVTRDGELSGAAVWIARGQESLRLDVTFGADGLRERAPRVLQPLAQAAWTALAPRWIEDPHAEPLLGPEWADELSRVALLPLVAYGRPLGVLLVYQQRDGRPFLEAAFDTATRAWLGTLSHGVALALDQADRCLELKRAAERERELRGRLQRLEAVAEASGTASDRLQELRHPVATLLAFARRMLGAAETREPRREYAEIVLREAERLETLLGAPAPAPPPVTPRLERVQPNELVQQALQKLGEQLVRRRIRLVKKLSPDVPVLMLDAARVREAVANLLQNSIDAVAMGGRIRIESRRVGGHLVIEIAHDGARAPGSALEQLFVPFTSGPGQRHSLGSAERIVREHGGEIRTRSESEWSAIVAFTLPIRDNEDRRQSHPDRRACPERRLRFPEAMGG